MSNSNPPRTVRTGRPRARRNYRAEYARRMEKGLAAGKSLSQARGHARAGERPKPARRTLVDPTRPEERGVKLIGRGAKLGAAAR